MAGFAKVGALLKGARVRASLSQNEVAAALGYAPQFISNWERGVSSPPVKILKRLARTYSISAEDLYEALLEDTLARAEAQLAKQFRRAKG